MNPTQLNPVQRSAIVDILSLDYHIKVPIRITDVKLVQMLIDLIKYEDLDKAYNEWR